MPTDEEAAIRDRLAKLAAEGRHAEPEAAPWQMSVSRNYRALHGPIMAAKSAPVAAITIPSFHQSLSGAKQGPGGPGQNAQQGGQGGVLGKLGGLLSGASAGSVLSGGLGDLIERFKQSGHGQVADSWVKTGPNQQLAPQQLEQAIGPDVLNTLSQHTGLSREELLSRLTRELPNAVDKFTPDGRLPNEEEAGRLIS